VVVQQRSDQSFPLAMLDFSCELNMRLSTSALLLFGLAISAWFTTKR
jgi:hypothetical protein